MPYLYEITVKKFFPRLKKFDGIKNREILAFAPHSDDLSIGAGGFLSQLAQENNIQPILAYSGFRGVDGNFTPEQATGIRENEMKEEARALGIEPPIFLNLATYEKNSQENINADELKIQWILKVKETAIIFLPNRLDLHPRHRLLSRMLLHVIKDLKWQGELFFYEIPWAIFASSEFNFIVSLPPARMQRKISAIKVHKTQLKRTNFVRSSKALMALRAGLVPEQKIAGYGSSKVFLGNWLEVYKYERL